AVVVEPAALSHANPNATTAKPAVSAAFSPTLRIASPAGMLTKMLISPYMPANSPTCEKLSPKSFWIAGIRGENPKFETCRDIIANKVTTKEIAHPLVGTAGESGTISRRYFVIAEARSTSSLTPRWLVDSVEE